MGTPGLEGKSEGLILEVPSCIEAHHSEAAEELHRNLVAKQELHIVAEVELHIIAGVELRIEVIKAIHNLVVVEDNHTIATEVRYRSLVVDSYQPSILQFPKTKLLILFWEGATQELHSRVEQGMAELAIHLPIVEYDHCL